MAGVGYRVTVTPTTVVELGDPGDEVFVYVHHHLREDAQTLYGFLHRDERRLLRGAARRPRRRARPWPWPSCRCTGPSALRRVLADDDVAALCLVPGVGKKTAARLLVELKSRLDMPGSS